MFSMRLHCSMRANHSHVLRQSRRQNQRLTPVSLRVPAELWRKCEWAAAAVGLDRTAFVRNTLTHAARDAQPPADAKSRMILATSEEWEAWEEMARDHNTTVDYLIRRSLNRLVAIAK